MTTRLEKMLKETPYASYAYAYPHKTTYSIFDTPLPLKSLWQDEKRDALFLYFHIPFCSARCGYCNLFTTANPKPDLRQAYLDTMRRQSQRVSEALAPAGFARLAIGGGTPTYLSCEELHQVFDIAEGVFGADMAAIPTSVETSPATATPEKLRVLQERSTKRVSIGIQSFIEAEVKAVGRAQKIDDVEAALDNIRGLNFPILNIDLIYGLPGQTVDSWITSLKRALDYAPEELYLYPLYVRPLTGISQHDRDWDDIRLTCYRAGRDYLLDNGYSQYSMRMFRRADMVDQKAPVYHCQEDGMVGMGCGARSYTRAVHYSSEYAVKRGNVCQILEDYANQPDAVFDTAYHGFELDAEEQYRRYIIKSLLRAQGLDLAAFNEYFNGAEAITVVPELNELEPHGLAHQQNDHLQLTARGLELTDMLGPWLYSAQVRGRLNSYTAR